MKERLGREFPAFLSSYGAPPAKGLRVNTLKLSAEEFAARCPFPLGERVPWEENGFYHGEEYAGADVYHFAGLYYLQEPSAMRPVSLLDPRPGERVLDMCAAPGGKTVQIAARMRGEGVLVANEIDPVRAKVLSRNAERMGVANCAVTNASPEAFQGQFAGYFDKLLVDAPCSGEGMFKKEPNAIPEWSEANVLRCAARQREILDCAAEALREGGRLVYSACTFAEEEDERQIEDFLRRHPEFALLGEEKLYPHKVVGEGHFCALLEKRAGKTGRAKPFAAHGNGAAERAFAAFADGFFSKPPHGTPVATGDGRLFLVPAGAPDFGKLRLLRLGVELGECDGKLFKPAHALAMAMGGEAKRKLSLSREEAERYLRGETVEAALPDGWCAVCVEEFPLGLGKCVNGTVKNHLPKGLRRIKERRPAP